MALRPAIDTTPRFGLFASEFSRKNLAASGTRGAKPSTFAEGSGSITGVNSSGSPFASPPRSRAWRRNVSFVVRPSYIFHTSAAWSPGWGMWKIRPPRATAWFNIGTNSNLRAAIGTSESYSMSVILSTESLPKNEA
jgi:hypothetical protein